MTVVNQVFSAFAFVSFILTANPFTWNLQGKRNSLSRIVILLTLPLAWNAGTYIYLGWISLSDLLLFINSVVWNGNVVNRAPVYCDITTKILVGASVAVPAGILCISRRLYHAIGIKAITRTRSEVECLSKHFLFVGH